MASENIMMKAVKKGGDRQELHERLREHAVAAAAVVKQEGKPNDMIARVEADPAFGLTREEIEAELSPEAFTGRSTEQAVSYTHLSMSGSFEGLDVPPTLVSFATAIGNTRDVQSLSLIHISC